MVFKNVSTCADGGDGLSYDLRCGENDFKASKVFSALSRVRPSLDMDIKSAASVFNMDSDLMGRFLGSVRSTATKLRIIEILLLNGLDWKSLIKLEVDSWIDTLGI